MMRNKPLTACFITATAMFSANLKNENYGIRTKKN